MLKTGKHVESNWHRIKNGWNEKSAKDPSLADLQMSDAAILNFKVPAPMLKRGKHVESDWRRMEVKPPFIGIRGMKKSAKYGFLADLQISDAVI